MASPPLSFPVTGHSTKILSVLLLLLRSVQISGKEAAWCSSQLAKHATETGRPGKAKGTFMGTSLQCPCWEDKMHAHTHTCIWYRCGQRGFFLLQFSIKYHSIFETIPRGYSRYSYFYLQTIWNFKIVIIVLLIQRLIWKIGATVLGKEGKAVGSDQRDWDTVLLFSVLKNFISNPHFFWGYYKGRAWIPEIKTIITILRIINTCYRVCMRWTEKEFQVWHWREREYKEFKKSKCRTTVLKVSSLYRQLLGTPVYDTSVNSNFRQHTELNQPSILENNVWRKHNWGTVGLIS